MGNLRRAFAAIRLKAEGGAPIPAQDWKVTGPGHHAYKATNFEQSINSDFKGMLTFTLLRDNTDTLTLRGNVADDGTETITLNGATKIHPDLDGDLAGHFTPFPPRFFFTVIVNFFYDDASEPEGKARFRVEANIGSSHLPGLP